MEYARGTGDVGLEDIPVPEIGEDDLLLGREAAGIYGSSFEKKRQGSS